MFFGKQCLLKWRTHSVTSAKFFRPSHPCRSLPSEYYRGWLTRVILPGAAMFCATILFFKSQHWFQDWKRARNQVDVSRTIFSDHHVRTPAKPASPPSVAHRILHAIDAEQ